MMTGARSTTITTLTDIVNNNNNSNNDDGDNGGKNEGENGNCPSEKGTKMAKVLFPIVLANDALMSARSAARSAARPRARPLHYGPERKKTQKKIAF